MKRNLNLLFSFLVMAAVFVSCVPETENFDEAMLIGKWVSGTEYYRYDIDKMGATWDTSDDVSEEEASIFEWSLTDDELLLIHIMEIGGNVPKSYTLLQLNSNSLRYEDSFGKQFSYQKVE